MVCRGGRPLAAGLALVFTLSLAPEARGGLWSRIAAWLQGRAPESAPAAKCDHGLHIDPNGCPRTDTAPPGGADHGAQIDPNG
jgi:hypothetical protein